MKQTSLFLILCFYGVFSLSAPLKLALNWKPEPQFGGFYEASRAKLFQQAGLDVQILPGGSGTPTLQMLEANQTEYAVVSADELILAADRGAKDLVAIFAVFQTSPHAIMTHAEKGYKTLNEVFADSKATLLWESGLPFAQYLKKHADHFAIKTAPYLGGIGSFQHDASTSQQCFYTSEPLLAKAAGLNTKVFLVAHHGYNPYTTVVVTKAARTKEKTSEVKNMVKILREGWSAYLMDPKLTNDLMHSMNKAMDLETFAGSAQAQAPLIRTEEITKTGLGTMTEQRWSTLIDQLFELGLIKTKPMPKSLFQNL